MVRCALFLVAAAAFVALVSSDEHLEKSKQLAAKCYQETNTTPADLKAFADGGKYSDGIKCFFKCTLEGKGGLNADGSLNLENLTKVSGGDKKATVDKCGAEATSADPCEKAFQFDSCFLAGQPEYVKATVARITS